MNSSNQRTRSMGKTALAKLFLLLLVLLTTQHSRAQFEEGKENTTIYMIKGTALQGINPTVTATYNAYPGEISHRIKNIITFRINEDTSVYMQSNFSATVNFTLSTTSAPTPVARSLTVNFDKADGAKYNVRAYMVLPNEEANVQVVVQSVNITGVWDGTRYRYCNWKMRYAYCVITTWLPAPLYLHLLLKRLRIVSTG